MATADDPNESKKQPSKTSNICQVCGDNATLINYGALSCLSCRTFFRRNAFPTKEVSSCRFTGNCVVNILSRRVCTACRLAKCLTVGMSPDFIRKEDLTRTKRTSGKSKTGTLTVMTIPQQSNLDFSGGTNHSYLNAADWTLISNILHAFNTFSPISDVRRTMEIINTSTSNLQYDVSQSLRLMSSLYNSLQLFISSTPDFKVLTLSEQRSLFQRNMLGLLYIGGTYLLRESGIFDKPENEMIILPLYGTELIRRIKFICQQLNCDPIVIKIMLIALAFSSNCFTIHHRENIDKDSLLSGTFRLFGSQNVYVELMWKYLMHTYNYNDSVQKFSTLMTQLLDILKYSIDIYENNQIHQAFIGNTIEQTETLSADNEKAIVPLWGKKL